MLRKGIVALMITVMSVGSSVAAEEQKAGGLIGFLRGPSIGLPHKFEQESKALRTNSGVKHAVVADAERQVPEIRQTSSRPQDNELTPAESAPQPLPVQYERTASTAPPVPARSFGPATYASQPAPQIAAPAPFHFAGATEFVSAGRGSYAAPMASGGVVSSGASASPGALYPSPGSRIPHQVGSSLIPHEAFHPHEMMYKHRYRAMYGPYFYQVHGGWIVTPFGVWSKENWKLKGTTVDVKYNTHISPFTLFHPPVVR